MNEKLMVSMFEELISEIKKHNEIQEEVKREMKIQNDLMAVGIENHREIPMMSLMGEMDRDILKYLRRKQTE